MSEPLEKNNTKPESLCFSEPFIKYIIKVYKKRDIGYKNILGGGIAAQTIR